jgi:hypothetical protein
VLRGCHKDLAPFSTNNSILFSSLAEQQTSLLALISADSNPRAKDSAYHLLLQTLTKVCHVCTNLTCH